MKTYKLSLDSDFAQEFFNNAPTGNWANTLTNQVFLAWLAEGNTPKPADIPPIVIPDISMRQARLALLADGLLDDVEAALFTPEYKIWWEYSTVVERNNYLVNDVLKILGKSDEEIDQMFIGASQL